MTLKELKDLYLDKTIFEVSFEETTLSSTGIDKVEFMISTNVGESLKPSNSYQSVFGYIFGYSIIFTLLFNSLIIPS